MIVAKKASYIIVCEGSSEIAYIQNLNRFLDDNGYGFILIPKIVGCGHFNSVQNKYRSEKKKNPKADVLIWVDKDTYHRNDVGDGKKYENKSKTLPDFMFSVMNFEDFLALHTDEGVLENWFQVCSREKHHINPMTEERYMPLFKAHMFTNYQKGDIPFVINEERLNNLFKNNAKYFFNCGFASFLQNLMSDNK